MLILSRLWERHAGRRLDGVLQVGDFGAFPDLHRLDDATARFARHDSDELGFSEYLAGCAEGAALLAGCPWSVTWCRGNHEDFDYLAGFRAPAAVDPWGKLIFVPDGQVEEVAGVRVGALGGMAPRGEERGRGKKARKASRRATARDDPRCFSDRDVSTAFPTGGVDVLLTHAGPKSWESPWGSQRLAELAERVRPRVHLFGHHHVTFGPVYGPGDATLIALDHLEFRRGQLRPGCWGVLELPDPGSDDEVGFTWGDELPFNRDLTREGYRHLLQE